MADTRPTVEYKLKSGRHVIVLQEYLTGREQRAIKNALWVGKTMQLKDGKGETEALPMDQMDVSTDKTIELMVVSIDGNSKDILNQVLEFRDQDYNDLLDKIEEMTSPVSNEKKANGPENTKS